MPTNIRLLQLMRIDFEIADNEDWLESLPGFVMAGEANGYRNASNQGSGTIGPITTSAFTGVGDHTVTITSVDGSTARFRMTDADGLVEGFGVVGTSANVGGMTFQISQGGASFIVGDSFDIVVLPTPIDITGIDFKLFVRTLASDALVYGDASTTNGQIINGGVVGAVAMSVLRADKQFVPGSYVVDMLAQADGLSKRIVGQIGDKPSTLTVLRGVTPAD